MANPRDRYFDQRYFDPDEPGAVNTTDIPPLGPFQGGEPNIAGRPWLGPETWTTRPSLSDIAGLMQRGGRGLMGGLGSLGRGVGRAVDAYGGTTAEAQRYGMAPRQAALANLGDLGKALMVAGGPGPQAGFGGRLGQAALAKDEFGANRRGELRAERQLDIYGQTADANTLRAMASLQNTGAKSAKDIQALRKEYNDLSKDWEIALSGYRTVEGALKSGDTGMSDQALLFSFIKIIDPGSVVREGERKALMESISIPDRFKGAIENWVSNKGPISEDVRADMLSVIANTFSERVAAQKEIEERYRGIAEHFGYDPNIAAPSMLSKYGEFQPAGPSRRRGSAGASALGDRALSALSGAVESVSPSRQPKPGDTRIGPNGQRQVWVEE